MLLVELRNGIEDSIWAHYGQVNERLFERGHYMEQLQARVQAIPFFIDKLDRL